MSSYGQYDCNICLENSLGTFFKMIIFPYYICTVHPKHKPHMLLLSYCLDSYSSSTVNCTLGWNPCQLGRTVPVIQQPGVCEHAHICGPSIPRVSAAGWQQDHTNWTWCLHNHVQSQETRPAWEQVEDHFRWGFPGFASAWTAGLGIQPTAIPWLLHIWPGKSQCEHILIHSALGRIWIILATT